MIQQALIIGEICLDIEREEFSDGYLVRSQAIICPICLRIWARLINFGQLYNCIQPTPCEAHPQAFHQDLRPCPGSLLDNWGMNGWDKGLLEVLPPDLLRREFNLHLDAYENLHTGDSNDFGDIF